MMGRTKKTQSKSQDKRMAHAPKVAPAKVKEFEAAVVEEYGGPTVTVERAQLARGFVRDTTTTLERNGTKTVRVRRYRS